MLKKGLLLLIMSSFLFISCSTSSTSGEGAQQKPAPSQGSETIKPTAPIGTFTDASYEFQGVRITYPQIETTDARQSRINQLIRSEAMKGLAYYSGSETDLTLDIKYELKHKGSRFLSIQYTGVGYVQGAAHPNNLFYTTNINLETVEKVRLQDILKIDQQLLETFKKGQWKPLRPEHEGLLQGYSDEDLMKRLMDADSFGTSDTFSYLTEDGVGISISVPHALGDHAEFEIGSKELADHWRIKPE